MEGDWQYDNKKINKIIGMLSQEERHEFACDVRQLDWKEFMISYLHGIAIWVLREDQIRPEHQMKQIVLKCQSYWTDWDEMRKNKKNFVQRDSSHYFNKIMVPHRFKTFLNLNNTESALKTTRGDFD